MIRALIVVAALVAAGPACAKPYHRVAPPQEFNFFSIFQQPETPRASKRSVRHASHVRKHSERRALVVRHNRRGDVARVNAVLGDTGGSVVATARSQVGNGAIYGRRTLWCARFMNWVLERTGHQGTGSDMAKSFASMPRTDMHVGAIAVMGRRGGGHVGIVSGVTPSGDPIIISGNHRRRVAESVYPRRRVLAFVEAR